MKTSDIVKQVCKGLIIGLIVALLIKPFKLVIQKGKDFLSMRTKE
jgi:hypothetical protein